MHSRRPWMGWEQSRYRNIKETTVGRTSAQHTGLGSAKFRLVVIGSSTQWATTQDGHISSSMAGVFFNKSLRVPTACPRFHRVCKSRIRLLQHRPCSRIRGMLQRPSLPADSMLTLSRNRRHFMTTASPIYSSLRSLAIRHHNRYGYTSRRRRQ
jgi:hypothetical protein